MKNTLKLFVLVLLLASVGLVVGNQLTHSASLGLLTPSVQVDKGSADSDLMPVNIFAAKQKVFIGSSKATTYHWPNCTLVKQIKPENQIWFSSSKDARSQGYVPCKVCNPP